MLNKQDEKSKHNDFLSEYQEQLQMIEEKLRDIEDSAAIIHSLLEAMLIFYGADRAYVIEADWDLMVGVNTYEICADGVTSHFDALQYLPGEIFPRWAKQLMNNQPVIITDTELIKEESPDEYALLKLQDIRSCLATPFSKKFNKGFIGVDNPTRFEDNPSYLLILTYAVVAELNEIKLEKRVNDAVAHFTQSSGSELYINCFGGLEIKSANGIILDDSISSDQCYQLLAYLIMNRKRVKPVRELADILWPNAAIEDPYHDVKNVVYRLKRFLSAADLDDLVIGSNGTYILNPKYVIRTDFDRFEEAYERFF
ncbi:MAG: hypothetical protein IJ307_01060, partial [Bacteroidales bacterium]|nr:hypothetical protein [Bacteroidales bacterium]